MQIAKRTLLTCLLAGASLSAQATVLGFDDVPNGTKGSFVSDGFAFTLSGLASGMYSGQICGPSCPVNGTVLALAPYGDFLGESAALTMAKRGGGTFSLVSFDGSGSFNFNDMNTPANFPRQIDVIGQVLGGATVTQSFLIDSSTLSGPLPLVSYHFNSSFSNLTSVTFRSSGSSLAMFNGFSVDNIEISPVPEPGSYAMLLAGLGLIGWSKRRRAR